MAFDEELMAGFASARKADEHEEPPASPRAEASIKAKRHRGAKPEPRDPAVAKAADSRDLRPFVDRIVRLSEEKAEVQDSIKAVLAQAKDAGYDVKALRIVVKRAMEDDAARIARQEAEDIAEAMMAALGMLADTPLGKAALGEIRH